MSKFSITPDLQLLNACRAANLIKTFNCDPNFLKKAIESGALVSSSCPEIAIPTECEDPGSMPGWKKM